MDILTFNLYFFHHILYFFHISLCFFEKSPEILIYIFSVFEHLFVLFKQI
nr:MAG TPA: hypothetical protein [Inoviridae sp.]